MTRRCKFAAAAAMAGLPVTFAASCQTPAASQLSAPPTIDIEALAYTIRNLHGQRVRTCGDLRPPEGGLGWRIQERSARPGVDYDHGPPTIFLFACPRGAPLLDRQGCITGIVEPRNHSVLNPPGGIVAIGDGPQDYDWYLRPHCPTP